MTQWSNGSYLVPKTTSIFNHQKDNNLYNTQYGLTYWMAAAPEIVPPKWKALDSSATMKIVVAFEQSEYATFLHKGRKTNTGNECKTYLQ